MKAAMSLPKIALGAAVALAVVAAGLADAANNTTTTSTPPTHSAGGNQTAVRAWEKARAENFTQFRRLALERFEENHTLAVARHQANESRIRTTFLDAKVALIESCLAQAAPFPRNASGPHSGIYAKCMRDGLKPLREKALADHKADRAAMVDAFKADRQAEKAWFQAQAQAWTSAHPRP